MSSSADASSCVLCGSRWGNVLETIDGHALFFCCSICARQYRETSERIRSTTGRARLDRLAWEGDRRGRIVTARWDGTVRRYSVLYNPEGKLLRFEPAP